MIILAMVHFGLAEMPLDFTAAMNNDGQEDALFVRNYETGASMTELYTDADRLNRNTFVTTRSYGDAPDRAASGGVLEASISSQVIGKAHIAWQSVAPSTTVNGRHPLIGRSVEDLTGVFSIEKFIELWSGSQPGEISVDWLPCS
ncbi:MAG: hypothetical protein A4E46_01393 [Methanosaeta sp. PtaU1.Bin016]|jgi:hypothetical protein|nr:MAG: hypothetical protein A4E46_01393 [Methanosaeta sp. PtaU1.Bin016]